MSLRLSSNIASSSRTRTISRTLPVVVPKFKSNIVHCRRCFSFLPELNSTPPQGQGVPYFTSPLAHLRGSGSDSNLGQGKGKGKGKGKEGPPGEEEVDDREWEMRVGEWRRVFVSYCNGLVLQVKKVELLDKKCADVTQAEGCSIFAKPSRSSSTRLPRPQTYSLRRCSARMLYSNYQHHCPSE
jgi:hypothetical protein